MVAISCQPVTQDAALQLVLCRAAACLCQQRKEKVAIHHTCAVKQLRCRNLAPQEVPTLPWHCYSRAKAQQVVLCDATATSPAAVALAGAFSWAARATDLTRVTRSGRPRST